jgi:regulator of sirC expression with transglutaminase-like and TPR domain
MAGDESGPPLDEAALAISSALSADFDDIEWLAALDVIAGECPTPTPDGVARYLFGELGFSGNREAYYDWRNSCLDRVIETRTGIPISLSVLMIEVGRRLGVQLHGVGMPAHFLVGVADRQHFFDPFNGGRRLDRVDVREMFEELTRGQVVWQDQFLEPTSNRAIVIRMLNNLKGVFVRRKDELRLGLVMQLRAQVPELSDEESDEIQAATALFN